MIVSSLLLLLLSQFGLPGLALRTNVVRRDEPSAGHGFVGHGRCGLFALIEPGIPSFNGRSFVRVTVHGRDGIVHELSRNATTQLTRRF